MDRKEVNENTLLESLLHLPDDAVEEWLHQHRSQLNLETINTLKTRAEEVGYGGELDDALRILDRAASVAKAIDAQLAMGLVWRGQANVLQRYDRFEESLAASDRAIALYEQHGTPFDMAVASTLKVYTLGALERFDEAIELALWIRPLFARECFTLGEAYLTANLAQVYTWAWRLDDALEEYRRARRLFLELDRSTQAAEMLNDMGVAADQMDRLDLAKQCYTQAYPDLVAAGDVFRMVKTQFNLALLCLRQGQYEETLEYLTQTRADLARLPKLPDTAYVDLFESRVRRALHQPAQAERLLRQALTTFEESGRHVESAETLIETGLLLAEEATPNSLIRSMACLGQAERHLQHLNVPLLKAWIQLEQGEFMLRLRRTTEAEQRAEAARAVFVEAGLSLRAAQAQALLADCSWRLQPDRAEKLYRFSLDAIGEDVPLLAARCWRGIGRLAAAAGDPDAAERAYGNAVEFLDTIRHSLRGHSHQAGFLEDWQELAEELLAVLHARSNSERHVLAWVERFKAAALADLLANQPPDGATDDKLACLLTERKRLRDDLDRQMSSLAAGINTQTLQRGPALAAHDAYRTKSISVIRQRLQELEEQIVRQRSTAYEWCRGVTFDPAEIHRLIDEQTTLVSYYTAMGQLYALTATQAMGDLQVHSLNSSLAEVEDLWWQTRRWVTLPTARISDVQTRLAAFWKILMAPLKRRLRGKTRLLILPHRGLFHLPFAGLYDPKNAQYLIERWAVQLAPSITILAQCQRQIQGERPPLLAGYPGHYTQPDYLPHIEKEIQNIAALLPNADILLAEQATAHGVMTTAPGCSFVHLAGHALYDSINPLESGVRLAGSRWLRASDLYLQRGHLAGTTVVLSGCSVGCGRPTGSDVLGLISAFLYAGASGVIAGLWHVDDTAAAELMTALYRELKSGADAASALRHAQLTLLHSEQHSPPYFWAPFTLSGDSRTLT